MRHYKDCEPQIYKRLPINTGKQKHPFSGRQGSVADVFKAQYRTNLPIPKDILPSQVTVDGTVDIDQLSMDIWSDQREDVELVVRDLVEDIIQEVEFATCNQKNVNNQEEGLVHYVPRKPTLNLVSEVIEVIDSSCMNNDIDFVAEPMLIDQIQLDDEEGSEDSNSSFTF